MTVKGNRRTVSAYYFVWAATNGVGCVHGLASVGFLRAPAADSVGKLT